MNHELLSYLENEANKLLAEANRTETLLVEVEKIRNAACQRIAALRLTAKDISTLLRHSVEMEATPAVKDGSLTPLVPGDHLSLSLPL